MFSKKNTDSDITKLSKTYDTLSSKQTYLFEMIQDNNNKTKMAKKGEETAIDQDTEDSHTTTIIKGGNTYLVLHDRSEYYIYQGNNVEQNILTDGLQELMSKEYTTGTEKIKGKKYSFEEYNCSTIFMISNQVKLNEEVKTKFYFDNKNNLVYVKTEFGGKEELLQINVSEEVDDSIFEIPSDYAEN